MIFYKSVASGNDFLHINMEDFTRQPLGKEELARQMCDRHTGPGGDGVVYYTLQDSPPGETTPRPRFEIFNCDGSEAELSGNGMGGLAALMFFLEKSREKVEMTTAVGTRTHTLLDRRQNCFRVNIHIGPPDFENTRLFPFLKEGKEKYSYAGIEFYPVSVGNPHVVAVLKEAPPEEECERIGALLEQGEIFPYKTNVEFVWPLGSSKQSFSLFFYERGVGRTLASSTGSAAVFAVLKKLGAIDDALTIPANSSENAPDSWKSIKITGKDDIFIENSVEIVYKGVYLKNHTK